MYYIEHKRLETPGLVPGLFLVEQENGPGYEGGSEPGYEGGSEPGYEGGNRPGYEGGSEPEYEGGSEPGCKTTRNQAAL